MENDFLSYLDDWEAAVNAREDVPDDAKQTLLLSAETMEGLRITGTHDIVIIVQSNRIVLYYDYL